MISLLRDPAYHKLITRQEQGGSPLELCMDDGGFKFEIQAFSGDVGVVSGVKERVGFGNDCFMRRNLNYWAVVHHLEEFVDAQLICLVLW